MESNLRNPTELRMPRSKGIVIGTAASFALTQGDEQAVIRCEPGRSADVRGSHLNAVPRRCGRDLFPAHAKRRVSVRR